MNTNTHSSAKQASPEVLSTMEKLGGAFAAPLATAWKRADPLSSAQLMQSFHGLYDRYEIMSRSAA